MRRARIFVDGHPAGCLVEVERGSQYEFVYDEGYSGSGVSLTMPVSGRRFEYAGFPPFFEGLLPEGARLDALLRLRKLDRNDLFGQLVAVGQDMVGEVTAQEEA